MKKHHRTIRIIYFTVLILGSFLVGVMISAFNLEGTIRQVVYWGWIAFILICALLINFCGKKSFLEKSVI